MFCFVLFVLEARTLNLKQLWHTQGLTVINKIRCDLMRQGKPEATVAHKMLMKLNQKTIEQMKILFTSAHALAKHGRPFSNFQWLCSLDEAKGLKVGTAYRNDKRCKDLLKQLL